MPVTAERAATKAILGIQVTPVPPVRLIQVAPVVGSTAVAVVMPETLVVLLADAGAVLKPAASVVVARVL
jgi:hypothetical protein